MKLFPTLKGIKNSFPLLLLAAAIFPQVASAEISLEVGKPEQAGTDTVTVTPPGGEAGSVALVLAGTESAEEKADKLEEGLKGKKIPFTRSKTKFTFEQDGVDVDVKSKQKMILIVKGKKAPHIGEMRFQGVLSGVDAHGSESLFQASLGFHKRLQKGGGIELILANARLSFSDLSGPTVDNLLQNILSEFRADLPESLRSRLSLDLDRNSIIFEFPENTRESFVNSFTSDITTDSFLGMQIIPVPTITVK
ncbi:MAG: hypothetical protein L0Y67_06410 [Gammaproteobacteria bacterium]|nr:hypothetical protein [Gammaproteobacteria bacterium]